MPSRIVTDEPERTDRLRDANDGVGSEFFGVVSKGNTVPTETVVRVTSTLTLTASIALGNYGEAGILLPSNLEAEIVSFPSERRLKP